MRAISDIANKPFRRINATSISMSIGGHVGCATCNEKPSF
jgi:hypothetical protein